jgi:hypothetical protein
MSRYFCKAISLFDHIGLGDRAGIGLRNRIALSGVIICPAYQEGTAVKGELLHHNQQFHYTAGLGVVSRLSSIRGRALSGLPTNQPEPINLLLVATTPGRSTLLG